MDVHASANFTIANDDLAWGPYSAFMLPKHGDHDAEEFLAAVRARVAAAN